MDTRSSTRVPIIASEAFYRATDEMRFNETANWIKYDHQSIGILQKALREMGQTRFINMNAGTQEARVSLVLYAGDGNLVKIMPRSFAGDDYVLQIPEISEKTVETDTRAYLIRTYPLILSNEATRQDVEYLRRQCEAMGQEFNPGDDTPRNIVALPDAEGTLTSIDADTFRPARGGLNYGSDMYKQWQEYLAELFPVYKAGELPPQSENTNFNFVMRHNPQSNLSRFDPLTSDPIIHKSNDGAAVRKRHSFWEILSAPSREQ